MGVLCEHVIPVPAGMEAEDAWAEIQAFGRLAEGRVGETWAVIEHEEPSPGCSVAGYWLAEYGLLDEED